VRSVWFLAGGAAGVYATSKARRVAEALSYDGVHDRLTGWFAGARVVRDELRAGFAEKEAELDERLALGGATVLALPAHDSRADTSTTTGTTDESRGDH
jgi:hypothetical protein